MTHRSLLGLACGAMIWAPSCSSGEYDFSATHHFGRVEVTIGLKSVSALAEYKQFAIIRFSGKEPSVIELFEDTGGYASVDVERDSCCIFLRTPLGNDAVRIDEATAKIQVVPLTSLGAGATLVGQFNFERYSGSEYQYFPTSQ